MIDRVVEVGRRQAVEHDHEGGVHGLAVAA